MNSDDYVNPIHIANPTYSTYDYQLAGRGRIVQYTK